VDPLTEKKAPSGPPRWVIWWTAIALLALFLYAIRSILPPFVIGAVVAYVMSPVVHRIQERWRLPRGAAIALLYLGLLVPLIILIVYFGPRLVEESRQLITQTPFILIRIIEQVSGPGPYDLFGATMTSRDIAIALIEMIRGAVGTPGAALRIVTTAFELTLNVFLSLIVSIYLIADSRRMTDVLLRLTPHDRRGEVKEVSEEIHRTLARYLRRIGVLVGLVSAVTFLGLEFLFHLRFALAVAVATGLLEIVPFVGPVAAGTVASIIALSQGGPNLVIGVIVFYFVLRQIEDQIVAPVVLGHAVELHPLVIIFAVLVGGTLFGLLGTLAAVPAAAALKVVVDYLPKLTAASVATPPPPGQGNEA
jgi:predicted PurR-regulated permease PerM